MMNISEHTRIFKAYLDRLTLTDLELICTASRRTYMEQLNGNANSQEQADFAFHSAVMVGLERMLTHDRRNIENVITRVINRETAQEAP